MGVAGGPFSLEAGEGRGVNDPAIPLREWFNERLMLMQQDRDTYRRDHAIEHERMEARRIEEAGRVKEDIVALTADINASGLRIDGKLDALQISHQQTRESMASLRTALFVVGTLATLVIPSVVALITRFVH